MPRGPDPPVPGLRFITGLAYLPDGVRFYCVFTRGQTWGVVLAAEWEGESLRDHSGSFQHAKGVQDHSRSPEAPLVPWSFFVLNPP